MTRQLAFIVDALKVAVADETVPIAAQGGGVTMIILLDGSMTLAIQP